MAEATEQLDRCRLKLRGIRGGEERDERERVAEAELPPLAGDHLGVPHLPALEAMENQPEPVQCSGGYERARAGCLNALDDFADLDAVDRDRVASGRVGSELFGRGPRSLFGFEREHGSARVLVKPDPLRGDEAGRLPDARNALLPQKG